ncbi:HEXXH motif domain-containing protein [Micromonospora sp. NBC_01699]|uniref:HEXXH motif domain-containing protein n=1 Tax=Micromonospora sp. NBC_01699 TaxID=2975984 RepID=UPI002E32C5D9|nr:HEXXH motif domain-containing protein [Micromonospora sp. NBC_01699]
MTEHRHPDLVAVRRAVRLLHEVRAAAPVPTAEVLTYPSVSAWLAGTVALLAGGRAAEARPGRIAAVTATAALRARFPLVLELPEAARVAGGVTLPSLYRVHLGRDRPGPLTIRTSTDGPATLDGAPDEVRWQAVRRLSTSHAGLSLTVCLDGIGRFCDCGCAGAEESADDRVDDEWYEHLVVAWRILVDHHRHLAEEVAGGIRMISPMTGPERGQRSGTFRHAPGCIAMSRPVDGRSAAVTLVHETQHTKLSGLMNLFPLITPGPDTRFPAPWRSDDRPLDGLLQGMYAHLGVTGFWREQRHHEHDPEAALWAAVEFARWRDGCREVAELLLGTGRLTDTGRRLVTGVRRRLDGWYADEVPRRAVSIAARLAASRHGADGAAAAEADPSGRAGRAGADAGTGTGRTTIRVRT